MSEDLPLPEPSLRPKQLHLLSTPELLQKYTELKAEYRDRYKKIAKGHKYAKRLNKILKNPAEAEQKLEDLQRQMVLNLQRQFEDDVKALLLDAFDGPEK